MPFPRVSDELYQLDNDIIEVFVMRTRKLADFSPEYQEKLKASYRFSAWRFRTRYPIIAPRTSETLDIT